MPALARNGATEAEAVRVLEEPPVDAGRLGVEVEREAALVVGEPGACREVPATGAVGGVELPLMRHGPEPAHDVERDAATACRGRHTPVGASGADLDRMPVVEGHDLDRGALTTAVAGGGPDCGLSGACTRRRHTSPRAVTVVGPLGGGEHGDLRGPLEIRP